jgi:calcium load-activated calcium channel
MSTRRITARYQTVEKEELKVVPADKRKAHDRNLSRLEEEVKEATNRMNGMKFGTSLASGVAFFFLYRAVASQYSGFVVAQLPFVPFNLLKRFSQRDLVTENAKACGFGLIYTLATMAFKTNIPRWLGFVPPRSAFDAQKQASRAYAKADAE